MDTAWIIAGTAFIGTLITIITFWTKTSDRITKAQSSAENSLQIAAESLEEVKKLDHRLLEIERQNEELLDRIRREFGETVNAMQTKIHEMEKWSRDEFVRKQSLEALLQRTEKAQEIRDERLERRLERIEKKLDEATSLRGN